MSRLNWARECIYLANGLINGHDMRVWHHDHIQGKSTLPVT
jgi:hypothetical protein